MYFPVGCGRLSVLLREIQRHAALEHFCRILRRTRPAKICTDLFGDDVCQRLRVREPEHRRANLVQPFLNPGKIEEVSYSTIREEDSGPSCSLAEALRKQDLFINSMLAQIGCDILWRMFREGRTFYRGAYLNLDTLRVNPIPV